MSPLTTYCGIDLSYTSPAFTVYQKDSNKYYIYYLTKTKKCQGKFVKNNFTFEGLSSIDPKIESHIKYYNITTWTMDIINQNHPEIKTVLIEGYSMNSRGSRTFDIGENAGMLKYALLDSGRDIIVKSPREIKKFFCGNGGVGKFSVEKKFNEETGFDIREVIQSKAENPVSDICDSYAMCKMMESL